MIDTDVARAASLARRFGIRHVGDSLTSMRGKVDAVVIATPPPTHRIVADQAFESGLDVLCEKPLAGNAADAAHMVETAASAGAMLAVAHQYRLFPNRQYVHQLIHEGSLGRPKFIEVQHGQIYSWNALTGYAVRHELSAGGVVLDEGLHTLDALLHWLGPPYTFQYEDDSLGGVESNAVITLQFPEHIDAHCRFSRTCKLGNYITVIGERAEITIPIWKMLPAHMRSDGLDRRINLPTTVRKYATIARLLITDFIGAIRRQHPPSTSGEEGAAIVALIEQLYASKRARPLPDRVPVPGVTF